jgi:phytoene dehydrogenase-like protein
MERVDVAVIGGGLAGWAAAAAAARAGASVTVVDRDHVGGRAATDRHGPYLFNRGAHAIYPAGPGTKVLRRLGVEPAGWAPPNGGAMGRLGDTLHTLPLDPRTIATTRLLGVRSKAQLARAFVGLTRFDPASVAHLTIEEWMTDLGLRDDARSVFGAIVRLATYVAGQDQVSADVAVTQLQTATSGGVLYLHGGWAQLVEGLRHAAFAAGARRQVAAARSVAVEGSGVEVDTVAGRLVADRVVLATGSAASAAHLLGETPQAWQALGPAAEASCLDVGLDHIPDVGLVIGVDQPLYLNEHAPGAQLAPVGHSVLHVMRYLRGREPWEHDQGRATLEDHLRVAGVDPSTVDRSRYLHRMTVTSALPVPELGGMAGRPGCESTGHNRILVAGDWVGPTGNLVDAPLVSGEQAGLLAAGRAEHRLAS